ncbi:hypothetical protein K1719_033106 [Acacia pycnantha]|nr:hypothetical protein K1719_033106 [Acacia pycnantha]
MMRPLYRRFFQWNVLFLLRHQCCEATLQFLDALRAPRRRHFPLEVFGCVLEGNSYLSGYSIFGPAIFVVLVFLRDGLRLILESDAMKVIQLILDPSFSSGSLHFIFGISPGSLE